MEYDVEIIQNLLSQYSGDGLRKKITDEEMQSVLWLAKIEC